MLLGCCGLRPVGQGLGQVVLRCISVALPVEQELGKDCVVLMVNDLGAPGVHSVPCGAG